MFELVVVNSIASDRYGNIYVQSRFRDGVVVFDENGEFIRVIPLSTLYSWCLKIYKDRLYFGATDGSIQVYDLAADSLIKTISPQWKLWDGDHNYDGRYTVPSGFCIFQDEIFVVDTIDHAVLCLSLDGRLKWKKYVKEFLESNPCPVRIDVNEEYVLISFAASNTVALLDKKFKVLNVIEKTGSHEGEFEIPWDVQLTNDYIYVSDLYNHRVQLFDYDLNFVRSYGSWGRELGQFNYVYSFEVSHDRVLFADTWNHGFQIWAKNKDELTPELKVSGTDINQVLRPSRVKVIDGTIVVTDYLNHSFKFFDSMLKRCDRVVGGLGLQIGEYRYPTGINGVDGRLYATDIRSGRVTEMAADGSCSVFVEGHEGAPMSPNSDGFVTHFENDEARNNTLQLATDIALDAEGNVYIADIGQKAIFKFAKSGTLITKIGEGILSVDNKTSFIGCEINDGKLYVTNPGKSIINIFSLDGKLLESLEPKADGLLLNCPTGISVNDHFIAIADRLNHRVVLLDKGYRVISAVGKLGNQEHEFCAPWDVALLDDVLIVADSLNNRVQRIRLEGINS